MIIPKIAIFTIYLSSVEVSERRADPGVIAT